MIASLLGLLSVVQQPAPQIHPDDPLHEFVVLESGPEGAGVELATDFEGTLHVWSRSKTVDPRLRVEVAGRETPWVDDDSGGDTTAFVELEVQAGETLQLRVTSEAPGTAVLHWIAAPESEATRAAAKASKSRLQEIRRLSAEGTREEAREHVEALVEELLRVEGAGTSARIGEALWGVGKVAYGLASPKAADRAFEGTHRERERLLPPEHPDLLIAKMNLAAVRYVLGNLEDALELQEQVHAIWERLLDPDDSDLLNTKANLAVTRSTLGDQVGALELQEQVHAAFERTLDPEDFNLLRVRMNLALMRGQLGQVAGALDLLESVHSTWERLLDPDDPDLLKAKLNLANVRLVLGDLAGALGLQEHVLAARERLLPPDHPDLLMARSGLAGTRFALGDLAGALALQEQAHAGWLRRVDPDNPHMLSVKVALANTRRGLDDLAGALELSRHVVTARERLLHSDHPDLLAAQMSLASTYAELGHLESALELQELVHAAWERLLDPNHPSLLRAKSNLAAIYRELGDPAHALELFEQVHSAMERLFTPDNLDLISAKSNLATARFSLGDLAGALELFEQVRTSRARLLDGGHPLLLRAKQHLASAHYALGDLDGAHETVRSLLQGQLERVAILRTESPRFARSAALKELNRLSWALFMSDPDDHGASAELFTVLASLRLVSTSSTEVALAAARYPELDQVRKRVTALGAELGDLRLSAPSQASEVELWRNTLLELSTKRDRLQRDLRARLAEKGITTDTPTVEAVARGLSKDSALVSFLRYPRELEPDPQTGERPPSVDSVLAFVVTPDGRVRRVELGSSAELEDLVLRWRALLGQPVPRTRSEDMPDARPIERGVGVTAATKETEMTVGRVVRARLLDPCLAILGARAPSRLHLVLDDFLHLVPVEALPTEDGRCVGEQVTVLTEVSVLRLIEPPILPAETGTLIALGGVDYGADVEAPRLPLTTATPPTTGPGDRAGASVRFKPLEHTSHEVEALERLFAKHAQVQPVVLMNADASKKALVELAPRARYLHVATHGWFAPETFKSMIDSAEQDDELYDLLSRAEETVRGFAPDTLCGLALAGANQGTTAIGRVPGILTAEELATLDLAGCELAVLSACETNVGHRRAGQGIRSLQGALHAAGVRTAITSLWRVGDAATRRLMELLYAKLWEEGLGKADALWQAKMAMRAEGHSLHNWAGWVLTGDPN